MSRHEGVSCDSCLKGNFRGKRYKCLICYDYDLCATCYEAGAITTRHTADHPMQCILTRTDFETYYGGEALTAEQPQAFSCPFCGKMGYTEASLQDHVSTDHSDASSEVVCPICAALPGGEPNHVTDDFAAHLTLEHRTSREFDEPVGGIRHVRRIPHPGRGMSSSRARRSNMHFQPAGSTMSSLSPSSAREATMDPIAELLSQLSNVRSRAAAAQSVSSQLQQLEMQLQSTKQQLERLPRRTADVVKPPAAVVPPHPTTILDFPSISASVSSGTNANSQFLLQRLSEPEQSESERQSAETDRADRSFFVQELLLSTLTEGLVLEGDNPTMSLEPGPAVVQPSSPVAAAAASPVVLSGVSGVGTSVRAGVSENRVNNAATPSSQQQPSLPPLEMPSTVQAPPHAQTTSTTHAARHSPSPGGGGGINSGPAATTNNLPMRPPPAASMVKHMDLSQSQERELAANTKHLIKH